jgi:1-phosphofructokinase/tagatose 6-phosphate kinase
MIITVTLNTAIDKTLSVPNFRLGRRHRTVEQTTMPGGKGVNVARVLKTLGAPVIATGFSGGATGTRIVDQLTQVSVLSDFVRIGEESRTNTAVIDPTTGEQTEINERGPKVTPHEVELFVDKLLYLAKGASVCVFAGSLPRDVDSDIYAFLIRELRRLHVTTVVDTDGDPLRRAVRAEPDVISPNMLESEELVGHEFNDDEDRTYAVREMHELGAREAIMTMPDGCFALMYAHKDASEHTLYHVRVRSGAVEPRAAVGSGDAFLAGFVAARYQHRPVEEALAYAVACGAESTQHLGAGLVDPDRVERLRGEIEVERPSAAPLTYGDRNRPRQEGAPRLWIRRCRHRPFTPHA